MFRYRNTHERTQYLIEKKRLERERLQKSAQKKAELIKHQEFKSNNIKLDKYVTYYRGNVYINKKSLNRLTQEANSKWTPSK